MALLSREDIIESLPSSRRRQLLRLAPGEREKHLQDLVDSLLDPDIQKLRAKSPQSELGWDIYQRLLKAAKTPLQSAPKGTLDLTKTAQFLAWLASCKEKELPWVTRVGLRWLGIERVKRHSGRPKGRRADHKYLISFLAWLRIVEERQLWALKQSLSKKYPDRWETMLNGKLSRERWKPEQIEALVRTKTARSFSIELAAQSCNVQYDTVQRAVRRGEAKISTR